MKYEGSFCPNCFDTGYANGECPKCGYREAYCQRTARALPSGVVLNKRYIIGKVLGEGGFGITYKACDLVGGRICAVKEYAPAGAGRRMEDGVTEEVVTRRMEEMYYRGLERFMEETQILRRLGNIPAVVNIFDCFCENHTAYFAMEFLDGANLNQIVRVSRHQLPFDEITGIILQVALAMDKIHKEANIFHRDISPENIFITRDNKVKLIDFGSAKEVEQQMSQEYSVLLKLKFSPPEQYASKMPQGPYTDVYALAATYYYALTGLNLPTAMDRLAGETYVSLKQMNMGISDQVSDAVDRALELNYQKRTQTMEEFARGISQENGRHGQPKAPCARMMPYAEVLAGQMMGARWVLPLNKEVRVGRSRRDSQIAIHGHPEISKIHCLVLYDEEKDLFYVRDLSTNGTFVNGRKLEYNRICPVRPQSNVALASPACIIRLGTDSVNMDRAQE